ncbi:MAG TPA: hypothetical protein VFN88_03275 [Caulobacteraceae bacterium]|nr:hypothetical protein [Caulobacteraceae bacterium]
MALAPTFEPDIRPGEPFALHFTPAEWRLILEDPDFLAGDGNDYQPRSLWGLLVKIVPDHRFG